MTDRDILDLRAYLATVAPSSRENRPNDVAFPFDMRIMMVPWRLLYFQQRGPYIPDPTQSAEWNRGAYLANAVAHCGECHTPRDWLGALNQSRRFAGAKLPGVSLPAPNISSDPKDGIGTWTADDIVTLLTSGFTRGGDVVSAPMSDVVAGTAKLSATDRHAIAVYVKSVPPQKGNPD
jgi:mono/diheme cytochrome c family protein